MKDYRLTVKVRNNRILKAIEDAGGIVGKKWCDANGLNYVTVNSLINMKISPILPGDGGLRLEAIRLCEALRKLPEELWSNEQLYPLERNFSEMEMSHEQILCAMSNDGEASYLPDFSEIETEQTRKLIYSVLDTTLTNREKQVIKMRFEHDMPFKEVANHFNVTQERIRQIEAKALRKLRHPSRSEILKECLDI